jgi:hypothetical protein
LALGAPALRGQETNPGALTLEKIQQSPARVVFVTPGVDRIRVTRTWGVALPHRRATAGARRCA